MFTVKIVKLMGPPFPLRGEVLEGAHAVLGHLGKFETLAGLANRLAPQLIEDQKELERDGYTPATLPMLDGGSWQLLSSTSNEPCQNIFLVGAQVRAARAWASRSRS